MHDKTIQWRRRTCGTPRSLDRPAASGSRAPITRPAATCPAAARLSACAPPPVTVALGAPRWHAGLRPPPLRQALGHAAQALDDGQGGSGRDGFDTYSRSRVGPAALAFREMLVPSLKKTSTGQGAAHRGCQARRTLTI